MRKSFEDLELAMAKEAEKEIKRNQKLESVGTIVRSIVKEFDLSRKSKPGFVQLRSGEELKAYNDGAKKEFKTKFIENKRRINDSAMRWKLRFLEPLKKKDTSSSNNLHFPS